MSQTWTDSTGGTGLAMISNNVEAYAPGNPIFAVSGDDQLTGSSGNDLMVFAQPIGTDVIHNFDIAHDTVDLIGFAGIQHLRRRAGQSRERCQWPRRAYPRQTANRLPSLASVRLAYSRRLRLRSGASHEQRRLHGDQRRRDIAPLRHHQQHWHHCTQLGRHETNLELIQHGITLQGGGQLTLSDSGDNGFPAPAQMCCSRT